MSDLKDTEVAEQACRRQPLLVPLIIVGLIVAIIVVVAFVRLSSPRVIPEEATPPVSEAPAAPVKAPAEPARKQVLPELVPGGPLDDDKFAQLSADIVIGAVGIKQDSQWELNVAAFMAKVLEKGEITADEYNAYAKALYDYPDRARAVAENIMMRVEKKLGYRLKIEKLPMFKFDPKTVEQMEKKLR